MKKAAVTGGAIPVINSKTMMQEEGERELARLLQWIVENQEKWKYICNPDFLELPVREKLELIESLEEAGLYSVAYIVFNSDWSSSRSMEAVRERFVNDLVSELPQEQLIKRMKNAMRKYAAKELEE
ncbi:MAG: hypothetical protein LUC99_10285 [Clostridiales bacterium]|nr:hypothetical protein [Clostridiales bacterium]